METVGIRELKCNYHAAYAHLPDARTLYFPPKIINHMQSYINKITIRQYDALHFEAFPWLVDAVEL